MTSKDTTTVMRYVITEYDYTKVHVSIKNYLRRIKQWDFDSLVTDKDFGDSEAFDKKEERSHPAYKHGHPTIDHADVWRQSPPPQQPHRCAMYRFLVSYAHSVDPRVLEEFRIRGFQVSVTTVCYFGKNTNMVIVAEERVNLPEAVAWASKRKLRGNKGSYFEEPICVETKSQCLGYGCQDHIEGHLFDTEELIRYGLEHGNKKLSEVYPGLDGTIEIIVANELQDRQDRQNPFPTKRSRSVE